MLYPAPGRRIPIGMVGNSKDREHLFHVHDPAEKYMNRDDSGKVGSAR